MPASEPSADDWLAACRRAVGRVRDMLAERPTIAERVKETGTRGEGGDRTLEIDEAAEDVIFAELSGLHEAGARFTAGSEGRGGGDFGSPGPRGGLGPIAGSGDAQRRRPPLAPSL